MGQNASETYQYFEKAIKDIGGFKTTDSALKKALTDFTITMNSMQSFLEQAVDSKEVAKARTDFDKDKKDFDKAKAALVAKKATVNSAQPGQLAKLKNAQGKLSDANKAASTLRDALKGKTGPEADLYKKVYDFARTGLTKINQTDDPKTIDDVL